MSRASRTSSFATTSATTRRRSPSPVFRSIYLKSLRDYRVPILGWGLGLGALMAVIFAAVPTVFATPAAKAAVVSIGASYAWIAEPIKIDTPGGYATWKYGITILVVVIWPLLAGTGMLRGEEDRGSMDVLLSLPRGRVRVALEKLAAMWTALLAMGLVIGLLTFAGAAKVSSDLSLGASVAFGLNLALICAVFLSIALLVSQFTQERRSASGVTAGILLVAIVVDMVHRVVLDPVVDPGHRRACRLVCHHRQADGGPAQVAPAGLSCAGRLLEARWERQRHQRQHPQRVLHLHAGVVDGLCRHPGEPLVCGRGGWSPGDRALDSPASFASAARALCRHRHRDDLHLGVDADRHDGRVDRYRPVPRLRQPCRRLPLDHPVWAPGGCDRLPVCRLAARRGGHGLAELPVGDLGLHQLHRPRAELAGRNPEAVPLLLLRVPPAARRPGGGFAR